MDKESFVSTSLNKLYDLALSGTLGLEPALQLASEYEHLSLAQDQKIKKLIHAQSLKCGTSGFLNGVGGLLTMPVALPLDLTANYYIQIRMVIAIAHLSGHDVKSNKVKSIVLACLLGNAAKDFLKEAGVRISTRSAHIAFEKFSEKVFLKINKSLGTKLAAKTSAKSVLHANKFVPVVGGFVGASFDFITCKAVGKVAQSIFFSPEPEKVEALPES